MNRSIEVVRQLDHIGGIENKKYLRHMLKYKSKLGRNLKNAERYSQITKFSIRNK
jgi:hypothetical protein